MAYYKSDVALLRTICQKFLREFHAIAGFDPFERCINIALTCNRYWRKFHLASQTVAVEPPRRWNGAQVNQSIVALEWLLWNEHQLSSSSFSTASRIQHVQNGGE